MIFKSLGLRIAFLFLAVSLTARATLIDRGGGLIYDSVRDITWYDFAYSGPEGTGASWFEAQAWVGGLSVNGITGWRLPSALDPSGAISFGDGVSTFSDSEMGHLYYELGNYSPYPVQPTLNTGPFKQIALYTTYWTENSVESTLAPYAAHYFDFTHFGNLNSNWKDLSSAEAAFILNGWPLDGISPTWHNGEFAMAVHAGDVARSVPDTGSTIVMLGLALSGIAVLRGAKCAIIPKGKTE